MKRRTLSPIRISPSFRPFTFEDFIKISNASHKNQHRILVIAADQEVAGTIALVCDIFNYRSTAVLSCEEALSLVKREEFDLIITEHDFPMQNGLLCINKMRQLGLEMPAILITKEPAIAKLLHQNILHIMKVLVKPLDISEIKAALNESFSR
jgi:DNA-binding NtrC family response regulator